MDQNQFIKLASENIEKAVKNKKKNQILARGDFTI